ncbi:hypothetical protein F5B22DRAFT_631114 [Xylaria bambusicola]|uniref:uncharacterized protein n=1 Tax=Xylaria bambusicola TaxID=326684 RepID=UPI00200850EF|nr:uncharacterized protein F5B22DRAFT_631114 [Xylaria bambusicola]KAI0502979.1 hypothetical protein F5B22DRAFT_631114 [Xylaria bambusicola]
MSLEGLKLLLGIRKMNEHGWSYFPSSQSSSGLPPTVAWAYRLKCSRKVSRLRGGLISSRRRGSWGRPWQFEPSHRGKLRPTYVPRHCCFL